LLYRPARAAVCRLSEIGRRVARNPRCDWKWRFIYRAAKAPTPPAERTIMVGKTMEAWTISILAILGLVIALNSLGLSVPDVLGSIVHGAEQVLNRPI
jgi:hypothetical protein